MTLSSFVLGESEFGIKYFFLFTFYERRKIYDIHKRVPSMGTVVLSRVTLLLLLMTAIKGLSQPPGGKGFLPLLRQALQVRKLLCSPCYIRLEPRREKTGLRDFRPGPT